MAVRTTRLLAALAGLLLAGPVYAQDVKGAVQLGLLTPIFSYTSTSGEIESPAGDIDIESSDTSWGLRDNPVLLNIGYGVTDQIVVGGFLQLGGSSMTTEIDLPGSEEQETTEFGVAIGPKVDFMFSPGSRARPFITGAIGFASNTAEDAGGNETSLSGLIVMAGGGVRAFVSDGFSLDPQLLVTYSAQSGEVETVAGDLDVSGSAFGVMLAIGFSGWVL